MQRPFFIAIYSVGCKQIGKAKTRKDYCESGIREQKYLLPFLKSVGTDIVAVFHVKPFINSDDDNQIKSK